MRDRLLSACLVIGVIAMSPAYTSHPSMFGLWPWMLGGIGLVAAMLHPNPGDKLITSGLVVVISLILSPYPRPYGYMYNANIAGNVLAVIILSAAATGKFDWRLVALALGLLLTGSIGAMLGAFAGLVVLYWPIVVRLAMTWQARFAGSLAGAAGIIKLSDIYRSRPYWGFRFEIWTVAGRLMTGTPGQDVLMMSPLFRLSSGLSWRGYWHAHNLYLQIGLAWGYWGLLLFGLALGVAFWRLPRPVVAVLVLWLTHGMVDCMIYAVNYYVIILALMIWWKNERQDRPTLALHEPARTAAPAAPVLHVAR